MLLRCVHAADAVSPVVAASVLGRAMRAMRPMMGADVAAAATATEVPDRWAVTPSSRATWPTRVTVTACHSQEWIDSKHYSVDSWQRGARRSDRIESGGEGERASRQRARRNPHSRRQRSACVVYRECAVKSPASAPTSTVHSGGQGDTGATGAGRRAEVGSHRGAAGLVDRLRPRQGEKKKKAESPLEDDARTMHNHTPQKSVVDSPHISVGSF